MAFDRGRKLVRSGLVNFRPVAEEGLLLQFQTGRYFTLNAAGRMIWEFCAEERSFDDIAQFICRLYGIPREEAERDAAAYLDSLLREELVELR